MRFQNFVYPLRLPVLGMIRLYQKTLSFDHGPLKGFYPHGYCRFHPTCSEYGYKSIKNQGIIVGGVKTLYRILRCNPWSRGGVDEPQ
ncbi:membrane protein insertion efficiency factor YidD [Candidatus Uhrbacteria bacterium CG10_big_fil_rev_8_21_14_0_10_50_16]|uniref:Putative membrane protein insertion efficiency factor n=1 Tax=Candidatus Uhrbacteria bacterium CG10_big_fil_rev_8_21_14_0_10_50_16 TaxID=1975039 RepID=A0A2H0RLL0_9BACT|nr:MAG: membrane protein insertion efficiency factor YidD [Candidatus Uhrbacteria bacterium CG10_big_fil_rev_8_21_14_0_10_50_16]